MGVQYTSKTILDRCENALLNPNTFYTQNFINYQGVCPDKKVPYFEIVAEFLCDNIDQYTKKITRITRQASYYTATHDGKFNPNSNRKEELIAMQMFNASKAGTHFAGIGQIIDYQTPLKSKQSDTAGKIDLLSYDGNTLHLLELKKPETTETMLRCVLEGFTYLKTVDKDKLISDFNKKSGIFIPSDTPVKASPLVFTGSRPHKDMLSDAPHLKRLMELLDSSPYYLSMNGQNFIVTA